MKPEEMERQEDVKNYFNEIQEVIKQYKVTTWRNLNEVKLIKQILVASDDFLMKRERLPMQKKPVIEETPEQPKIPTLEHIPEIEVPTDENVVPNSLDQAPEQTTEKFNELYLDDEEEND